MVARRQSKRQTIEAIVARIETPDWKFEATRNSLTTDYIIQNWDWQTLTYHNLWSTSGYLATYSTMDSVASCPGPASFCSACVWVLDLADRRTNRRVLAASLAVAVVAELTSRVLVAHFVRVQSKDWTPKQFRLCSGLNRCPALSTASIAICVRAVTSTNRHRSPLVATGQMALTWYFAHIVLGLGLLVALGLVGTESLPKAGRYVCCFSALQSFCLGVGKPFFAMVLSSGSCEKSRDEGPSVAGVSSSGSRLRRRRGQCFSRLFAENGAANSKMHKSGNRPSAVARHVPPLVVSIILLR